MGILDKKPEYVVEYQHAVDLAEQQLSTFWLPLETEPEKDKQDVMVNMTEAERHGVVTTLKLFTLYEVLIGGDYWLDLVFKWFDRPADIQRMAMAFSFMENCVHAPFYNEINKVLGLADEEFYNSYLNDPTLFERVQFMSRGAKVETKEDVPLALAHLTISEGIMLFSNFAFLKHFQSQGKNKLMNIVRGINFAARDETLHMEASSWLFRTLIGEGFFDPKDLSAKVHEAVDTAIEHEKIIIGKVFEKGKIDGITEKQMKNFIMHRGDEVLKKLGYDEKYKVTYNPISTWFGEDESKSFVFNDFFSGQGNQYSRDWSESSFSW